MAKLEERCELDSLLDGISFGRRLLERYGKPERGTASRFAFHSDMSTHQFDQLFADGQTKSGPAIFACRGAIRLNERLKQPGEGAGRDPDSRIAYGKTNVRQIPMLR